MRRCLRRAEVDIVVSSAIRDGMLMWFRILYGCWMMLGDMCGFGLGIQQWLGVVLAVCHLLEGVPGGDGAQRTLHMCVNNLKAVDVGCVDPAEAIKKLARHQPAIDT